MNPQATFGLPYQFFLCYDKDFVKMFCCSHIVGDFMIPGIILRNIQKQIMKGRLEEIVFPITWEPT
jgi:hypothetical protein